MGGRRRGCRQEKSYTLLSSLEEKKSWHLGRLDLAYVVYTAVISVDEACRKKRTYGDSLRRRTPAFRMALFKKLELQLLFTQHVFRIEVIFFFAEH